MLREEMLARMTSPQLSEWLAYYSLEPGENGYLQAATVAASVANFSGFAKRLYCPADFMPKPQTQEPEIQSPEEGMRRASAIFSLVKAQGVTP
jgi:hypothetical protein